MKKKIILMLALTLCPVMSAYAITETTPADYAYQQKLQKQEMKYKLKVEKLRQKEELKRLKNSANEIATPIQQTNMTLGTAQKNIKIGTSQDEVAMALGSPNIVTVDSEGRDTWIYDKVASVASYNNSGFTVGAGGFGGGGGANGGGGGVLGGAYSKNKGAVQTTQKTLTIVIKFENNKVCSFKYHMSNF